MQIKWHIWVWLNYPSVAEQRFIRRSMRMISAFRTRHGKVSSSRNLHACLLRVYTSIREKKKRTLKKRSENRRVLSIRAHMYSESCGPSSPASAGFPRSFSRLDLSLLLFLFLFVFSLSWVLEVRTVITPHLPVLWRRAFIGLASTHLLEVTAFPCEVPRWFRPSPI